MPEISAQTFSPKEMKKMTEAQLKAIKRYQQNLKDQGIKTNYNKPETNRHNQYKFNTIKMIKYLFI